MITADRTHCSCSQGSVDVSHKKYHFILSGMAAAEMASTGKHWQILWLQTTVFPPLVEMNNSATTLENSIVILKQ